ncbi:MAG: hypothetical protein U0V49_08670 [Saprospiraceae bacterium]
MSSSLTLQNDCKCFGISDDNIQLAQLKQYINYYQYNQEGSGRIRVGTRTNNTRSSNPLFDFTTVGGQVLKLNRKEVINSEWYHFNRNLPFSRSEIRSLVFIIGSDITFVCGPRITGSLFPLECSECGNGNNAYEVSVGSRFIWKYIEGLKANEVAAIPIELAYKPAGKPNFNDGKLSVNFLLQVTCVDLSQHCETAQTVRPLSGDSLVYIGNTNSTTLYNARFNYYPERGGLSSDIVSNQTGREKILLYRHNRNRLTLLLKTAQNQNVFVLSDCEKPIFKYKVGPNNRTSKTLPAGNYYLVIDSEKSSEGGFSLLVKSE